MFADMIRQSNSDNEIYLLLTSYIEAVRYGDKLHGCVPQHITHLPLSDIADVKKRSEQLMAELDAASRRLDDNACMVIKEGLHVFGSALSRLNVLDKQQISPQNTAAVSLDAHAAHMHL